MYTVEWHSQACYAGWLAVAFVRKFCSICSSIMQLQKQDMHNIMPKCVHFSLSIDRFMCTGNVFKKTTYYAHLCIIMALFYILNVCVWIYRTCTLIEMKTQKLPKIYQLHNLIIVAIDRLFSWLSWPLRCGRCWPITTSAVAVTTAAVGGAAMAPPPRRRNASPWCCSAASLTHSQSAWVNI